MANVVSQIVISAIDKTKAIIEGVKGRFEGLSKSLKNLTGFNLSDWIGGLTVKYAVEQFRSLVESIDAVGKSAQKVGTTTENLSALQYAAKKSDIEVEQLDKGLEKLAKTADDFKNGSQTAVNAFALISIDPTKYTDTADLLGAIADKFKEMPDGAQKTAAAMALLGKSGADLIPLLNGGSAGIAELTAEARRLGIVIDEDTAKAAERFNDNLTAVETSARGAGIAIANALLPKLGEITKAMAEAAQQDGPWQALWVGLGGLGAAAFTDQLDSTTQKLNRLRDQLDFYKQSPFINADLIDSIKKQIAALEQQAAAEQKVADETAKADREKGKHAAQLEEDRRLTTENTQLINEQIADASRLQSALQTAYDAASKAAKTYAEQARQLREQANAQAVGTTIEDQALAALDAITKLQALQRNAKALGAAGSLDQVQQQADAVRNLANQLDDAATKQDLLKQANLAQADALDAAAKSQQDLQQGLTTQETTNQKRLDDLNKVLESLKTGAVVNVEFKGLDDAEAKLTNIQSILAAITATPMNVQITTPGDIAGTLQDAALKTGGK